jgi:hypothetical protein
VQIRFFNASLFYSKISKSVFHRFNEQLSNIALFQCWIAPFSISSLYLLLVISISILLLFKLEVVFWDERLYNPIILLLTTVACLFLFLLLAHKIGSFLLFIVGLLILLCLYLFVEMNPVIGFWFLVSLIVVFCVLFFFCLCILQFLSYLGNRSNARVSCVFYSGFYFGEEPQIKRASELSINILTFGRNVSKRHLNNLLLSSWLFYQARSFSSWFILLIRMIGDSLLSLSTILVFMLFVRITKPEIFNSQIVFYYIMLFGLISLFICIGSLIKFQYAITYKISNKLNQIPYRYNIYIDNTWYTEDTFPLVYKSAIKKYDRFSIIIMFIQLIFTLLIVVINLLLVQPCN